MEHSLKERERMERSERKERGAQPWLKTSVVDLDPHVPETLAWIWIRN